jgi:ketosteroid isomerase-like protein
MSVALATDTVQRAHAALAHGDREGMRATCDPLIRWTVSAAFPFGGVYSGIDDVETYFSELARHFSSLLVTLTEAVATTDTVVEHGTYRGVARDTQIPFEVAFCVIWQLRDGRVYEVREYADSAPLNAALVSHFTN